LSKSTPPAPQTIVWFSISISSPIDLRIYSSFIPRGYMKFMGLLKRVIFCAVIMINFYSPIWSSNKKGDLGEKNISEKSSTKIFSLQFFFTFYLVSLLPNPPQFIINLFASLNIIIQAPQVMVNVFLKWFK